MSILLVRTLGCYVMNAVRRVMFTCLSLLVMSLIPDEESALCVSQSSAIFVFTSTVYSGYGLSTN